MTNGLVTVRVNGQVTMKIVTGNEGYNAPKMAKCIRERWPMTVQSAYDAALEVGFGTRDRLVVITATEVRSPETNDYDEFVEVSPLYGSTFHAPEFNPRWYRGTAAYTEVIDV